MGEYKGKAPKFIDAPPNEWPNAATVFYNLVATAAERIMERKHDTPVGEPFKS